MEETSFVARIQKLRRIAIPKKNFNMLDLDIGGTVEVTVRKLDQEEEK